MQFYLQFSYNMQKICRELITEWGGGTVIMNPRDCQPANPDKEQPCKLEAHATSIKEVGGRILIDPMFYVPTADHRRLTAHSYWPSDYDSAEFWDDGSDELGTFIQQLSELNHRLGVEALIVPGTTADAIDDEWLQRQSRLIRSCSAAFDSAPLYATVSLSADALKDTDRVHELLTASSTWPVGGIYLLCEHPEDQYFVGQDWWTRNMLDVVAGFSLRGLRVIVGYSNPQTLVTACAGATAIASGTHRMKRRFSRHDTMNDDDDEGRQATWYYCPQAYSEFKLNYLDLAYSQGILDLLRPPREFGVTHSDRLFAGAIPSSTDFKHALSWKHYLGCMRAQAACARQDTFDSTADVHKRSIDLAMDLLKQLEDKRIRAEERSYLSVADATFVAITNFARDRGPILRRKWSAL